MHESRHSNGGEFYRVSFDGCANGGGNSCQPGHSYNESCYYEDWDSSYYSEHYWGCIDANNDSCYDSSNSQTYNYNADWSWKDDGTKSHSVTNTVTGYSGCSRDGSYDNHCEYHYDYGFGCDSGYSCSVSDSCSTSCTTLDASDTISRTGWGYGQPTGGGRWSAQPFGGSITEYSCSCSCFDDSGYDCSYSYSYNNADFYASNFRVTMIDETYNGDHTELYDVWHPGRGNEPHYGSDYNDYAYSYSAPGSHIPNGSAPNALGGYGNVNFVTPPLNYNGTPNLSNYEIVDPEAILDEECPKPGTPSIPPPSTPLVEGVCFAAGTLVLLADSSMKRIEEIVVGDAVFAKNDKLPNGQIESHRINEIKHNPPSVTYHLVFRTNTNDKEINIRATPEHPFYVPNRGWVAVENLNLGDVCTTPNENKFEFVSKKFDPKEIPVFNLEVDEDHTYFVGDDPENCLLVHNQYTIINSKTDTKIFVEIKPHLNTGEISIYWFPEKLNRGVILVRIVCYEYKVWKPIPSAIRRLRGGELLLDGYDIDKAVEITSGSLSSLDSTTTIGTLSVLHTLSPNIFISLTVSSTFPNCYKNQKFICPIRHPAYNLSNVRRQPFNHFIGDYLFQVKENQSKVLKQMKLTFEDAPLCETVRSRTKKV